MTPSETPIADRCCWPLVDGKGDVVRLCGLEPATVWHGMNICSQHDLALKAKEERHRRLTQHHAHTSN